MNHSKFEEQNKSIIIEQNCGTLTSVLLLKDPLTIHESKRSKELTDDDSVRT